MSDQTRGKCPECGYSFRLRKGGTLPRHSLYVSPARRFVCKGSYHPPASKGSADA